MCSECSSGTGTLQMTILELAEVSTGKWHRVLRVQFRYGTLRITVLELAELSTGHWLHQNSTMQNQ
jgi:hypothetical protein